MSLREQLYSIYETHGKLTPPILVAEARDPEHPLHNRFVWDDSVAAERYRESQAAELIRSVKVVFAEREPGDPSVRQFVHVERPDGNTYVPIEKVAQDPFASQLIVRQAEREWKTMLRRYQALAGFMEMVRNDVGHTDAAG